MKGRSYIASIKARTSLVPTRLQTLRELHFTHGLIVRRHDVIVKKPASLAETNGFTVTVEPTLRHDDLVYKPDLIAVKGSKAWVIDVAIPFESADVLARRHAEKSRKYACLAGPVCKLTGAKEYATGSIVIGARGGWCSRNNATLKEMQWSLTEQCKGLLCTMVLERTNQLISWFMRTTTALAFQDVRRTRGHGGQERTTSAHGRRPTTTADRAHRLAVPRLLSGSHMRVPLSQYSEHWNRRSNMDPMKPMPQPDTIQ
uniref:Uncharacterized protein n=1 Tax=Trichuris muris TaxID=70415 RepID=A0A5S6QI24_TRIMR